MRPQYSTLLKLLAAVLLYSGVSGCTSLGPTKPNIPYAGPYPSGFNELAHKNPSLADELGKLPELQDGISESEAEALDQLCDLYEEDPEGFDAAFKQMYDIGKPEVRKFCTPLQAIFWLVQKDIEETRKQLEYFHLESLLEASWDFFEGPRLTLSEQEVKRIINSAKNDEQKKEYYVFLDRIEVLNNLIFLDYKKNPYIFSREARKIIKNSQKSIEEFKWQDFSIVTERLNAPELLDFYINRNIHYKKNTTNSHTPKHTFSHKWGDCDDLAIFGEYILRKGGYKAIPRYVHWTANNRGHVGVIIKLEYGGYFIAVDFDGRNKMTGPYTKMSEVDEILSRGNDFHDSGWYRPRH